MEIGSRVNQKEAAGKRLVWSPQPILGGKQVHVVQAQKENVEKGALQRENGENKENVQKYW